MSKCISKHGEYSEHTFGDGDREFTCLWCWSFDEDAALAVIKDLRAALAAVSAGPEPEYQWGHEMRGAFVAFVDEASARSALSFHNLASGSPRRLARRTVTSWEVVE